MASQKTVIPLLVLLIGCTFSQTCIGPQSQDLIQTGIVSISNPSTSDRVLYAQVQIDYQIPQHGFQAALSPAEFSYNVAGGMDFNLKGGRIANSSFLGISLFLRQDNRWSQMRVSYIANSRLDIWVGSFTYSIWELNRATSQSGQGVAHVQGLVHGWSASNTNLNFLQAAFISGIRSDLTEFNVSLFNVTLDKSRGALGVTLVNASLGIEQITISYVIFVDSHPIFSFSSFGFPGTVPNTDYQMIGISEYGYSLSDKTAPFYYGVAIESQNLECRGSCPSGCLTKAQCSGRNGTQVSNTCFLCPEGTVFNSSSNSCGAPCGVDEVSVNGTCQCRDGFVRLGSICVNRCGSNQQWTGSQCECLDGYARLSGACRKCPASSSPNTEKTTCVCASGFVFDPNTTRCISRVNCPPNSSPYIQNAVSRCRCDTNYHANGGQCSFCPSPARWNSSTRTCVCPTQSQYFNGEKCISCLEGQFFNSTTKACQCYAPRSFSSESGKCQCPEGLIFDEQSQQCLCSKRFEVLNQGGDRCECRDPYIRLESGQCGLTCPENEWWFGAECLCKDPYVRVDGKCTVECPSNERWNGIQCVCSSGHFRIDGVCQTCPAGTTYNSTTKTCTVRCHPNERLLEGACVCKENFYRINTICSTCPADTGYNSSLGYCTSCGANQLSVNSRCVCSEGFYIIDGACGKCPSATTYNSALQKCEVVCGDNETVSSSGSCECAEGYYRINGTCSACATGSYFDSELGRCVERPTCPVRSVWSQARLECVCSVRSEYLIDGQCRPCGQNQGWNGSRCVCRSGYFMMRDGSCVTCNINTTYNSTLRECVCNRGFYGDRFECFPCDATCGRCTGAGPDKCTECYDLSYTFDNGFCDRKSPCVEGQYLDGQECKACSSYCSKCEDETTCTTCTDGFSLSSVPLGPIVYSYCEEICGDGKRFEFQCDDGNTDNGDGCSDQCEEEAGYTCSGGTTTSRSFCAPFNPTRTFITPNGAVQFAGKVLQGVTLSYLPDELIENGCANCNEVLLVTVVQGQIFPSYRVNYRPTTQFKFLVEFDFRGIFGIPPFTFTLRINPDYASYFSEEDLAQEVTVTVDTAILALGEEVEALTLDEILGNSIAVSDNDLEKIFE